MSSESFRQTIVVLQGAIDKLQEKIKSHKQTINHLCGEMNEAPLYPEADEEIAIGTTATRSDEFYGKPLATAVRTILERRKRANLGAATVPEIYKAMKDGAFHFEAKNEANAQRSLHIAMSKNAAVFHRLPNSNKYGLREWYPAIKDKKAGSNNDEASGQLPLHEELQADGGESGVKLITHAK
jgi:hypothetical protein